jgi:hypothetical protein
MHKEPLKVTGSVIFYRIYDICWEIDLKSVESSLTGTKRLKIERKRFSRAFEFANPPITVVLENFVREIMGTVRTLKAYGKVYDFGAMSIILEVPVTDISMDLLESMAREFRLASPHEDDFIRLRDNLVSTLRNAMSGRGMPGVEEEYTIYYIHRTSHVVSAKELCSSYDLPGFLLSEEGETRPGEAVLREFSAYTFSYSDYDLAMINWDNALVLEPSGAMDIPDLLEFANAQLLALRVYDELLDREIDTIYSDISRKGPASIWKIRYYQGLAAKVMRTFTDLTYITEKVDNSLKVTDDVYYSKVYSAALELFKVKTWEESIKKKFDIASRVYNMLNQTISNRRNEILELTIIILIAIEIILFVFWEYRN